MRKLAIMAALATTALASPAMARNGAWYVGVEGGAMIVEDIEFDVGALSNATIVDSDTGYDVGAVVDWLGEPPVLIGHSMGGFVVQKYLEHHTTPGAALLC